MTWELKSRQSPRTYADLIGIVALRIIEIGDQSALRFPSLPGMPFFLLPSRSVAELAYRTYGQEVITYVFINYAILRVIMRRVAEKTKEIGEQPGAERR